MRPRIQPVNETRLLPVRLPPLRFATLAVSPPPLFFQGVVLTFQLFCTTEPFSDEPRPPDGLSLLFCTHHPPLSLCDLPLSSVLHSFRRFFPFAFATLPRDSPVPFGFFHLSLFPCCCVSPEFVFGRSCSAWRRAPLPPGVTVRTVSFVGSFSLSFLSVPLLGILQSFWFKAFFAMMLLCRPAWTTPPWPRLLVPDAWLFPLFSFQPVG